MNRLSMFKLIVFLVLSTSFSTVWAQKDSPWHTQTTVYQIYPRSFQDSDGDGIGDLNGISSRLGILQELGVETIWISPFFESPLGDWGYDISDYRKIGQEYGSMEDFRALVQEIHARKMHIVLDLVMNHTSEKHTWFQQSIQKDPAYTDYYVWADGKGRKGKRPPTNWKSLGTSGWTYDDTRKQHYWSSFLPFQPDLNYRNPAVKSAMFDMVRFWLNEGVDGFRLDMFNAVYEDSLLRDNPFSLKMVPAEDNPDGYFQKATYNMNREESYRFATELRAVLDEFPGDRYLVGEVYGTPSDMRRFCWHEGKPGLHSVFLFESLTTPFTAKGFRDMVQKFEREFPSPALPTYVFSNHDRVRSFTRIGEDIRKAKLLATFQLTARGIPFIYYGEEIGMVQASIPRKQALDPMAHRYPWLPNWLVKMTGQSLNRDECRTPMHWDDRPHGGFSENDGPTWIRFNPSPNGSFAEQGRDESSLWNTYRTLLKIRKENPALHSGSLYFPDGLQSRDMLCIGRAHGGDSLIVMMNFSNKKLSLADFAQGGFLFSTEPNAQPSELNAWEGRIVGPLR